MSTIMLSPHFSLAEFTISQTASRLGLPNTPSPDHFENLKRTAKVMELVRTILLNKPILISSGYRAPQLNEVVGGSKTSAHCYGLAADFTCPGYGDPRTVCKAIEPHLLALGADQLIYEFDSWVHLGLSEGEPRHMAMTISSLGTSLGIA